MTNLAAAAIPHVPDIKNTCEISGSHGGKYEEY
jgi:hypothetical protein